jgi:hypothetical protein
MGNTILAHALHACSKSNFDIQTLFSEQGHAHKIIEFNQSELIAWHFDSNYRNDIIPILHIVCNDWDELLRIKLSYSKWFLDTPSENNFLKFGFTQPENNSWLENLTLKYYTMFQNAKNKKLQNPTLQLGDYIDGNVSPLQNVVTRLGWNWDSQKSKAFHRQMIMHNWRYISWVETIKTLTLSCVNSVLISTELEFWEKALVIAKVCDIKDINPMLIHWDNFEFLDADNATLIESLERIKNGKTI